VRQENLAGHDDQEIWAAAQAIFLICASFGRGRITACSWCELPNAGRAALTRRILETLRTEDVESWKRCFVVLSEHKLRVLRAAGD